MSLCTFSEDCRQLEFKPEHTFNGKRLKNHLIRSHDVMDGNFCEVKCYMEHNCVSYNLKKVADEHVRFSIVNAYTKLVVVRWNRQINSLWTMSS